MSGLGDLTDLKSPIPAWLTAAMAVRRQEHWLSVDGCRIHYFSWGEPAAPGLLFTHGRMSHARCWGYVAPLLSDRYHCVALDFSGMGDSGWRKDYPYSARVEETLAVAEASGLSAAASPPILVSHSYGAVIAVKAIATAPDGFRGLVACDPSLTHPARWSELTPRENPVSARNPGRIYPDLQTAISRYRFAPPQPVTEPVLTEYLARHSLKPTANGWQWKFDPLVYSSHEQGHDDWWVTHSQEFVDLHCPKAIIYGAASDFLEAEVAHAIATACSDSLPVAGIAEAHHHLMADQPIALATGIEAMADGLTA